MKNWKPLGLLCRGDFYLKNGQVTQSMTIEDAFDENSKLQDRINELEEKNEEQNDRIEDLESALRDEENAKEDLAMINERLTAQIKNYEIRLKKQENT